MILEYDYGAGCKYKIRVLSKESLRDESASFPRPKPLPKPTFAPYTTNVMDLSTFELSSWVFDSPKNEMNPFQPGRKKSHGFLSRDVNVLRQEASMAAKSHNLTECVVTLNAAAKTEYAKEENYPRYSWHSILIFPESNADDLVTILPDHSPGCFDLIKGPRSKESHIDDAFSKIAALGGWKKDKAVPKGWLTYQNDILTICKGTPPHSSNTCAPPNTAFRAMDMHKPGEVVLQTSVKFANLHQLVCYVEGFLRTLYTSQF